MYIKLKVHPDSRQEVITKKAEDAYEIWVKSPAERGLANAAALRALAVALAVDVRHLRLIKGATSPSKIVQVRD